MYYSKNDSIEKIGLSVRSLNALQTAKITTIEQLLRLEDSALRNIKNLGAKSIEEIFTKTKTIVLYDSNLPKQEASAPADVNTFYEADVKEYQDLPIEALELSNRSYNCLKRAGVFLLSELIQLSQEDLFELPNMGAKSVAEIMRLKTKYTFLPVNTLYSQKASIETQSGTTSNDLYVFLTKELSSALCVPSGELFAQIELHLQAYFSEYNFSDLQNALESERLWKCLLLSELIVQGIQSAILIALNDRKYGSTFESLLQALPAPIRQHRIIREQLLSMDASRIISEKDGLYFVRFMTALEYASSLSDERRKLIFTGRIKGRTLEDLGMELGIQRERIRQLEAKILQSRPPLYEDQYADIFEKYDIQRNDFILGFHEPADTYNYLNLAYKHGDQPVEALMDDTYFPEKYRRAAEKIVYKNYVRLGKDMVSCKRADLCDYVLRVIATDDVTFDDFTAMYYALLLDLGLRDDPKFDLSGRGYENKMAASDHVLWKQWKTMRYYRIAAHDYTELLETLDLSSYQNVEYSTLKFFLEYPELMMSYDIRDEYELHNLLKKICTAEDFPNLNFKRMPTLEFGTPNRDRQITDLLISSAPISKEHFAELYEHEYGVKAVTVMANYSGCISQYLDNGIYKIDLPALPDIMFGKLKSALSDDFYLTSELIQTYITLYPTADRGMINSYTINSLGFHSYSNYLVSTQHHSAVDYFRTLLTADDIIDLGSIKKSIWSVVAFSSELYKRRAEYEIIEFSSLKYINIRRLESLGVTREDLQDFCAKAFSFAKNDTYFTIHSLRKNGFHHALDDLGFESRFYSSILAEDKLHFSYRRIGGLRLFKTGSQNVLLEDFIENIIYSQDSLSMDLHDLINFLDEKYDLQINRWKLLETIYDSSMYYDKITEKVYAEYEIYFETI